jgi:hypothetical protein
LDPYAVTGKPVFKQEHKERKKHINHHTASITQIATANGLLRVMQPQQAETSSCYVLWSEEQEVRVTPNSAEWFGWLDGLTSFDFDGKDGDFTAFKETSKKEDEPAHWIAYQKWEDREYKRDLGATSQLTTSYLEEIAADLEEEVATKEIGGTGEGDLRILYMPAWKDTESKWCWNRVRKRTYHCLLTLEQK